MAKISFDPGEARTAGLDFTSINAAALAAFPAVLKSPSAGRENHRARVGRAQSAPRGSQARIIQGEPI